MSLDTKMIYTKKNLVSLLFLLLKVKKKVEILNEFKKRISNSVDNEFNEAISQVSRIANLRLNEINIK